MGRLEEVLTEPDIVVRSERDPAVLLYQKRYAQTPVSDKFLLVAVKLATKDAFVITAFFTDAVKKGERIWEK